MVKMPTITNEAGEEVVPPLKSKSLVEYVKRFQINSIGRDDASSDGEIEEDEV